MDRRLMITRTAVVAGTGGVLAAAAATVVAAASDSRASSAIGWLSLALLGSAACCWFAVRWADTRRSTAATAQILSRIAEVRTRTESVPLLRQMHRDGEQQVEMLSGIVARLESQRAAIATLRDRSELAGQDESRPDVADQRVERSSEVTAGLARRLGREVPATPPPSVQDPELELKLSDLVLTEDGPAEIGVIGDGAAAIVAAMALSHAGRNGRVRLVDHRPKVVVDTEAAAADLGLESVVDAVHVPLVRHSQGDRVVVWYDDRLFVAEWGDVELLVIVEPSSTTPAHQAQHRHPSLQRLIDQSRSTLFAVEADASTGDSTAVAQLTRPRQIDDSELAPAVWNEPYGRRASYMNKLHESKRRSSILQLLDHRQPVWAHNDKLSGYRLAQSAGVSTPGVFYRSTTLEDVDWMSLPPQFVVKPLDGANNRGVFLLVADQDGRYLDLMDDEVKTLDDVKDEYAELFESKKITRRFAVEELLRPGPDLSDVIDIPDDLKVYCFYDRSVVAMQRRMNGTADRSKWTFKFWSRTGDDLGPVKYPDRCDPDLQRPDGLDEVFEAADAIGRQLSWPFCRLDFFATSRGPVFGELAPHPGPPEVWDDATDEWLGREWELAEARLLVEGAPLVERRPG